MRKGKGDIPVCRKPLPVDWLLAAWQGYINDQQIATASAGDCVPDRQALLAGRSASLQFQVFTQPQFPDHKIRSYATQPPTAMIATALRQASKECTPMPAADPCQATNGLAFLRVFWRERSGLAMLDWQLLPRGAGGGETFSRKNGAALL